MFVERLLGPDPAAVAALVVAAGTGGDWKAHREVRGSCLLYVYVYLKTYVYV